MDDPADGRDGGSVGAPADAAAPDADGEVLGRLFRPAQRVLAVLVLALLAAAVVQWTVSARSAQRAVDATTGVDSDAALIGFTQRESLATTTEVERWLAGQVSRRDVQIARALLARRLSTVGINGTPAGELAGEEYRTALRDLDVAFAAAPPGRLGAADRDRIGPAVDEAVVEVREESKQLSDRYLRAADDQLRQAVAEAASNDRTESVLLGLTLAGALLLLAWLAVDVRRSYRSARSSIARQRADLDVAERALGRATEFEQGEAELLGMIISGSTLAEVLHRTVELANHHVGGGRFRLVLGEALVDPATFDGMAHVRAADEVPDEVSPGRVAATWPLVLDDDVPPARLEHVLDVADRDPDPDETLRVATRCADLAAVAVNRHHAAARLQYQASHDALTGLVNRASLLDQINSSLRTDGDGGSLAVLFIDLDRFKLVNDSLGHKSGDLLLVEVAARLQSLAGTDPMMSVARLGGDEFVIVCGGISRLADAEAVADRVAAALVEPVDIDDAEVFVNASIGVAFASPHVTTAEQLLRNADVAMYRAKRAKSGGYVVYNAALEADVAERLEMDSALRRATARGELRVYLQPVVDMVTRQPESYEALLRWDRPDHGLVMPDVFIPMAEETGVIVELGEWVLRRVVELVAEHRAATGTVLQVAVNVSARQLLEPGFAYRVLSTLFEFNVPPTCLTLELTESSLIELRSSGSVLDRLRQSGIRVAMDDFGTGYSSLLQLQTLPIDVVKLDRAFIAGLSAEPGRRHAVLAAATTLVQASGLELVVEGVETEYEREELLRLDCRLGQGYLFARPAPAAEVVPAVVPDPASA